MRVQEALHTTVPAGRHIVAPAGPATLVQGDQSIKALVARPMQVLAALDTTDRAAQRILVRVGRHTTAPAGLAMQAQEGLAIQVQVEAGRTAQLSASSGVTSSLTRMTPNPSIEGMPKRLRLLCTPHVKR